MTSQFSSGDENVSRAVSRFLAVMSHEIRTPLNGIIGALQLLTETTVDPAQAELVGLARSSANRLSSLASSIFDLSQFETGKLELEPVRFDFAILLEDACEYWRPLAVSKGLHLELHIDQRVPRNLFGDAMRIRQIADNYLSNAIAYTEQGGVDVVLQLDNGFHNTGDADSGVLLEVSDTGAGISREDQMNLFSTLYQKYEYNNRQQGGAGLGLAICHALATRMGGSVGVVSTPGAGSRFWVRLSLPTVERGVHTDSTSANLARPLEPLRTVAGKAPYVLLVEDSLTNQLIARAYLDQFGCHVDVASNGLEALNAVKKCCYDIILMDVAMPKMDGMEATRLIRALPGPSAFIPIIGLTAYSLEEQISTFLAGGMSYVLNKPLQRELLRDLILAAIAPPADSTSDDASLRRARAVIELAVLEKLKDQLPAYQFTDLLNLVMTDIESNCRQALAQARNGEINQMAKTCHTLKGLGASFGCRALELLAGQIQESCRAGDSQQAVALALSGISPASQNALAALGSYQQTLLKAAEPHSS